MSVFGVVQPVFDTLTRLVERAGTGDVGALSGSGGAELQVVADIWRASRGELTAQQVLRRHGFHGPREGELSSVVWREDPSPVLAMIDQYATRPDGENPVALEGEREPLRVAAANAVLAALPAWQRPAARVVLTLARDRIPMRGMAKRAFLQALDVARAAARRVGELLAGDGVLSTAEDGFFLTVDELRAGVGTDAQDLISRRRERWNAYRNLLPPGDWTGNPVPRQATPSGHADTEPAAKLAGIGVSPGVVVGTARFVTDPSFADVEPDEVLVAPTTDPSWASIMFISSALVVDIGGALSHAAVVARELGLPCVVNTRSGSTTIRTGDRVRVDGTSGTVEILESAAPA